MVWVMSVQPVANAGAGWASSVECVAAPHAVLLVDEDVLQYSRALSPCWAWPACSISCMLGLRQLLDA